MVRESKKYRENYQHSREKSFTWSILTLHPFAAIVRNRVTKFEFYTDEKLTFLKGTWHLKG